MLTGSNSSVAAVRPALAGRKKALKSLMLTGLMLLSTLASIQYAVVDVQAASDQDGDGLTYGLEYLMNTQPNAPDSDNDGLPDGWEWKYGLDPLSSPGADGAVEHDAVDAVRLACRVPGRRHLLVPIQLLLRRGR